MRIWTDGSCIGNGTPQAYGAWAFVAATGHTASGCLFGTSSQRAELQAVIEAVRWARALRLSQATVYTDCLVTAHCYSGRYRRKANRDLWAELFDLRGDMTVTVEWIKGHSGIPENELCDRMCTEAMTAHASLAQ